MRGDPRSGRGPKKGAPNAGRPTNDWLAFLRETRDSPKCRAIIRAILTGRRGSVDNYLRALADVNNRLEGLPTQPVTIDKPVLVVGTLDDWARAAKGGT